MNGSLMVACIATITAACTADHAPADTAGPEGEERLRELREKYAGRLVPGRAQEPGPNERSEAMAELLTEWSPIGHTFEDLKYVVGHSPGYPPGRHPTLLYSFGGEQDGTVFELMHLWRRGEGEEPRVEMVRRTSAGFFVEWAGQTPLPPECEPSGDAPDASAFDGAPEGLRERLVELRERYSGRIRPGATGEAGKQSVAAMDELLFELSRLGGARRPAEEKEYLRHPPTEAFIALVGAEPNGARTGYQFTPEIGQGGVAWRFVAHCGKIAHVAHGGWVPRPFETGRGQDEGAQDDQADSNGR